MNIPERALPFVQKLESFLQSKRMAVFQREALDRFAGEGRDPDDQDRQAALDYVLFAHRDQAGRKLVDHFLEEKRDDLGDEEREVFSRFRESTFGFFQVEEVRPGEGLRLRRAGTDEVVEVVDAMGSRELSPKMGLFAHLLPFQGRYQLAGGPQAVPPQLTSVLGREVERLGAKGVPGLSDPVAIYQAIKAGRGSPPPVKNLLEAELQAAVLFSEIGFPLAVEEVQRRFQGMSSPLRLLDEVRTELPEFKAPNDADRFLRALLALWKHTPRDEFQGKSPHESMKDLENLESRTLPSYLVQDLLREVKRKLPPEQYFDASARQAAERDWFTTHQEQLEGFSPEELLSHPLPPPPPPEDEALPPPDEPRWPDEAIQGFLDSGRPAARFWALEKLIGEGKSFPLEAVPSLLDESEGDLALDTLLLLRGLRGEEPGLALPPLRKAVADRLQKFRRRDRHLHDEALETLKWLSEAEALRSCGTDAERRDRLLRQISAGEGQEWDVWDASGALEALLRSRERETVAKGVAGFLERLVLQRIEEGIEDEEDYDDPESSPQSLLLDDLEGMELQRFFLDHLRWMLFPDYCETEEQRSERCRQVVRFLEPSADPQAAGRSSEVLGPRRERLLRLLSDGEVLPLCSLLEELAREALDRARVQNPRFESLAQALEGFLDGAANRDALGPLAKDALAAALFGVLFKAIQGRHLEGELAEGRGDPEKLLEFLQVNDPWIEFDKERLGAFAILPPSDLLKLAESADHYVRRNALLILAAVDPVNRLDRFLDECADDLSMPNVPISLVRCAGDAILLPLAHRFHRHPSRFNADHLLDGILWLRTQRAGAYLAHYFPSLVGRAPSDLAEAVIECGSPDLADEYLDRLSRGCLELEEARDGESEFDDLLKQVKALLALYSLSGDADEIAGDGIGLYETRLGLLREPEDRKQAEEEPEEESRLQPEDWRGSNLRTIEPIRREKPKVGRNDPCPCGSGKKHKKCCGKGG